MSIEKEETVAVLPRRKVSCTTSFDALWFCYSPVHQMQQYYRLGSLDNCSGKWNALVDCLKLKTKRSHEVEEILETREKEKTHIWSFRTPEEAASNWNELFGHHLHLVSVKELIIRNVLKEEENDLLIISKKKPLSLFLSIKQ